jgi:protein-S-isoprenylcysteine O-methyltransferase Ste14
MSVKDVLTGAGDRTNVVDRILSSPSLFMIALGALMVVVAVVLQNGTWPAIMVIFGASLVIAGGIAQAVRLWTRRKS